MAITQVLTAEQIQKNKEDIIDLLKSTNRPGIDKLIDYLNKSDFFTAPASTKYHGAYEGGLAEHSLHVYSRLFELISNENRLHGFCAGQDGDAIQQCINSAMICGLLHDICKVNLYSIDYKNVKVYSENGSKEDKDGKYDWVKEPIYKFDRDKQAKLPMGHGEKSIWIISGFIKLSRDEAIAIRWHMGAFDDAAKNNSGDLTAAFTEYPMALMLHIADMQATYLDDGKG